MRERNTQDLQEIERLKSQAEQSQKQGADL